jgi:Na+/melibiose symporter-like transporter
MSILKKALLRAIIWFTYLVGGVIALALFPVFIGSLGQTGKLIFAGIFLFSIIFLFCYIHVSYEAELNDVAPNYKHRSLDKGTSDNDKPS